MINCETCGAENRNKARFCRGCARPLVALGPQAAAEKPRKIKTDLTQGNGPESAAKVPVSPQPSVLWRWILLLAAVVAALALGVRQWSPEDAVAPPTALDATSTQQTNPAPLYPKETFIEPATPEVVLEAGSEAVVPIDPPKVLVERSATPEKKAAANAMGMLQRQSADEARQAQEASVSPDAADALAQAGASAAALKSGASVERACAQATNFVARDLCRIEACRKPSNASDPICVWYRKLEEERRSKTAF